MELSLLFVPRRKVKGCRFIIRMTVIHESVCSSDKNRVVSNANGTFLHIWRVMIDTWG